MLQQALKSWSNFSLVLFGKGGYLENFEKSTYGYIHIYPYMVSKYGIRFDSEKKQLSLPFLTSEKALPVPEAKI